MLWLWELFLLGYCLVPGGRRMAVGPPLVPGLRSDDWDCLLGQPVESYLLLQE